MNEQLRRDVMQFIRLVPRLRTIDASLTELKLSVLERYALRAEAREIEAIGERIMQQLEGLK